MTIKRLEAGQIACHSHIIAELALGSLKERRTVLGLLDSMHALPYASAPEIRRLIDARGLAQRGIGYVDVSLIAATLLAPGATLWTRDKRLAAVAGDLGIAVGG